jgi:formylmethanofuran dehydrogenase subunit B
MQQTFTDVACTVCGCLCDDLEVDVSADCITQARGTCRLSEPWFAALSSPIDRAVAVVEGKPAAISAAIERAADILRASKAPLIWGLTRSSTAGQRAAIALAEQIGGTIDTPLSIKPQAALAFQKVGQSTCTLGEVRNRADLVIFWRANPVLTHPRHLERYSVEPTGMFLPRGRADRTVVVVDFAATETSELADSFLQIAASNEHTAIEALRALVKGEEPAATTIGAELLERLRELAARMTACNYGALFVAAGQAQTAEGTSTTEALFTLTAELNKSTRFTVHSLGAPSGMVGAENVLTWQTGFPFAVNFAEGYPTFNAEKFAAEGLLERGDVDACLLVGSESVVRLSAAAQSKLRQVPTIALDYPNVEPTLPATVQFTTAIYGIHAAGTAYRMDGVSIPMRPILSTSFPMDEDVLARIAARLKA